MNETKKGRIHTGVIADIIGDQEKVRMDNTLEKKRIKPLRRIRRWTSHDL